MKTNTLPKIDAIVFDFDGTLAELRIDFAEMKHQIGELALSYSKIIVSEPFLPVLEWMFWLEARIEENNGNKAGEFRQKALDLILEIEMEAARKGALFEFTRPVLDFLHTTGVKTAIITRNCDAAVRLVFPDIDSHCGAFFARDHVLNPKPDPAHLIRALEAVGANFGTALIVGDHPIDIQTGKAAGIRTAGVLSGSASRAEMLNSGADWVARDCQELIDLLRKDGLCG